MKKDDVDRRRFLFKIGIGLILIAVIGSLVWFFMFRSEKCEDWSCFNSNIKSCDRAEFFGGSRMIFEYTILGKEDNNCVVNVKMLQGDLNNKESRMLEGLEMKCYLPLGVVMLPEADLGKCHGQLKENWQDLVIRKLYDYIVQNLGKINLDVLDVPGNFSG